jgi:hypothetical protein
MAPNSKKILDGSLEGEKPLGLARGFKSAHLPLPLAGRLMRGFGAIVGVAFCVLALADLAQRLRQSVSKMLFETERELLVLIIGDKESGARDEALGHRAGFSDYSRVPMRI